MDIEQQEAIDQFVTKVANAFDTWRRKDEAFKLGQLIAWELALKVMQAQRRHIGRLEARVAELEPKTTA